jgi:hypothetical protein
MLISIMPGNAAKNCLGADIDQAPSMTAQYPLGAIDVQLGNPSVN